MYRIITLTHRLFGQTGRSDISLTEHGVEQIKSKAPFLVGDGSMWSGDIRYSWC